MQRIAQTITVVAAVSAGAVGGSVLAPPDPLGGWLYSSMPVQVCTSKDGEGFVRVEVRPDIITSGGQRVYVPEFRDRSTNYFNCHTESVNKYQSPYESMAICHRQADDVVEVTIEGRQVGIISSYPDCIMDIFNTVMETHPIVNGVPQ